MHAVNGEDRAPPFSCDEAIRVCMQHALCTEFVVPLITELRISTKGPAPMQNSPHEESPSMPIPEEVIRLFVTGVALHRFCLMPQLLVEAPDALASERFMVALHPPE
jgi:hypothetical protein